MKAITTKYVGPTNTRGARIIASDGDGNRVTVAYDYNMHNDKAHSAAARALCEKMGWHGVLIAGGTTTGYVYVWLPESVPFSAVAHCDYALSV
jgi:hypothetical protein